MRIISDFHDYYDVGMQNGVDPQLPYRRFRREEPIQFPNVNDWRSFGRRISYYGRYFCCFFIGFAGKVWPCMDVSVDVPEPSLCFEATQIDDKFIELAARNFYSWNPKVRKKDLQERVKHIKEDVYEFFEYKTKSELIDLFDKFNTAIFVHKLGNKTMVINERLNLYDFQKILPPMQAFQELEMYVGSYLTRPVIEEPPISDKIKAEIHGFDKFSFRKDKTTK